MGKEILFINANLIFPNLYQPRKHFDEESIDELAQSISAYGIIQPISVRKLGEGKYELVAGERRVRAARKIGLKEIPAIVIDITDKDSAAIALLENLQREDLNYLEEGEAYLNLMKDHGYTQEKLAEVIGKKQSTIANKIRILKLAPDIRVMLIDNKLTERHARSLLKLPTDLLQRRVLKKIIDKSLNVKKTEELVESELFKLTSNQAANEISVQKLKGIFSSKIYINTVKQVFNKCGVNAEYTSKESDDKLEIKIIIPKGIK